MHTFRLFFALEIDPQAKKQIIQISQELKQLLAEYPLRWVKPDLQHITLKFLGDVDPLKLEAIDHAIKLSLQEMPECSVSIGGLGAYPHLGQPRVIWIGARPDLILINLYLSLEKALTPLGYEVDQKGYSPHLTLARMSDRVSVNEKKAIGKVLKTLEIPVFIEHHFTSITLFRSDLQRSGPVYTKVHTYPLNHNLC